MVAVENVIVAAVMVLALTLTFIATLAWRRTRDVQLVFLGIAFGIFFVKALVLIAALFFPPIALSTLIVVWGAFDLAILVLFYGFTLRR
ncbi:MAG TPA: hypothetical protein VJ300_07660 [Thermoplasmata archaeon]|nr:hypothetical protein [Thermoplasmata archaeon]